MAEKEEDTYTITTKMNLKISQELGIDDIKFDERIEWEPPEKPGLDNSEPIIPKYYHLHKHPYRIFDIDYFNVIKDDVRNFRALNIYQLSYIKRLSPEQKNEIIDIYNECISVVIEILT
jgi:hypothetical protein